MVGKGERRSERRRGGSESERARVCGCLFFILCQLFIRLWGSGKSTTKQQIFDTLKEGFESAQKQSTKKEKYQKKKQASRHWWANFFDFANLFSKEEAKIEEGVYHIPVDLNAWVFSGTGNEWASILIEVC